MTHAPFLNYSKPYIDTTVAFMVQDHRRREFSRGDVITNRAGLRIAIPDDGYYLTLFRSLLPKATLVPLQSVRSFFEAMEFWQAVLHELAGPPSA